MPRANEARACAQAITTRHALACKRLTGIESHLSIQHSHELRHFRPSQNPQYGHPAMHQAMGQGGRCGEYALSIVRLATAAKSTSKCV